MNTTTSTTQPTKKPSHQMEFNLHSPTVHAKKTAKHRNLHKKEFAMMYLAVEMALPSEPQPVNITVEQKRSGKLAAMADELRRRGRN